MTISRAEVITSVERRRRWSQDEKERLVAASLEPGASVSELARQAFMSASCSGGAKSFASEYSAVRAGRDWAVCAAAGVSRSPLGDDIGASAEEPRHHRD